MHGETLLLITQNEDLSGLDQEEHIFSTDCAVQMYPCESLETAATVMDGISMYNIDPDNCRAYSGAIFSVKEIPKNIKGLTPYIIINVSEGHDIYGDTMEGVFKKIPKDIEKICDTISKVLSTKVRIELDDGYLYDDYPDIENTFLFLGKQLELSLTVNTDSVDEELIDRIDSICDDVLDGKSIEINENYVQNSGDSMTIYNTIMTVNHSEEGSDKKAAHRITGRLLGMCTSSEAIKIAENKDISRRIHTGLTAQLPKVVELLNEQHEKNQRLIKKDRAYTHVVLAVKGIKDLITNTETEIISRKLYISPPIDLVSGSSTSLKLNSATFECTDGTMCSVMEKLD